jgi:hypothetical protein
LGFLNATELALKFEPQCPLLALSGLIAVHPCLATNVLDRAVCGTLLALRFLSHRSLLNGGDEPETLPYANPSSCSMGADAGQFTPP